MSDTGMGGAQIDFTCIWLFIRCLIFILATFLDLKLNIFPFVGMKQRRLRVKVGVLDMVGYGPAGATQN